MRQGQNRSASPFGLKAYTMPGRITIFGGCSIAGKVRKDLFRHGNTFDVVMGRVILTG